MDRLSRTRRSWNMSRVQAKNTEPEMLVRSVLHRAGFRFRLHVRDLPATPDITLPKHRIVVLVHGCFWHRHPCCRFAYTPKSNIEFWNAKFRATVARDQRNVRTLRSMGWHVITVWECQAAEPSLWLHRLSRISRRLGSVETPQE